MNSVSGNMSVRYAYMLWRYAGDAAVLEEVKRWRT
jgi:hypothetical protein